MNTRTVSRVVDHVNAVFACFPELPGRPRPPVSPLLVISAQSRSSTASVGLDVPSHVAKAGVQGSNEMTGTPTAWIQRGIDAIWAALAEFVTRHEAALRAAPVMLLVAIVCRLPAITTLSISIDDEFTAWRTDPDVWAQQGRWTNWLIETFLLNQPCVPFFTDLLFCTAATVSYLLLLNSHRLPVGPLTWLAFPLFCSYPQWDLIGEFYGNVPGVACGLVCVAAASCLFQRTFIRRTTTHGRLRCLVAQVVLVASATGCYQSFLLMFAAIGCGLMLRAQLSLRPPSFIEATRQACALVAVAAAAAVTHQVIAGMLLSVIDKDPVYVTGLLDARGFLASPLAAIVRAFKEVRRTLCGSPATYGFRIWGASIIFGAGWAALLAVDGGWRSTTRKALCFIFATGCCLAPFALHVLAAVPLPQRIMVAIPYVAWLFAVLPHLLPGKGWRLAAAAGLAITTVQVVYLASISAAARDLVAEHDRQMAADLYARLAAAHADFDLGRIYPVVCVGAKPYTAPRYPSGPDGTARGSFFWWGGGETGRIVSYMRLLGYGNLAEAPPNVRVKLRAAAADMPNWPTAGSVRVIDGVTVFKLGGVSDVQ